jgi:hypothetical protein
MSKKLAVIRTLPNLDSSIRYHALTGALNRGCTALAIYSVWCAPRGGPRSRHALMSVVYMLHARA